MLGTLLRFTLFCRVWHYLLTVSTEDTILNFREQKEEVLLSALTVFQVRGQLYGSCLTWDFRGEKEGFKSGVQGQHKNSRESEHQQFEIASGFCFSLLLKANPQMRGLRCENGVSGGGQKGEKHKHLSNTQQISIFKIPNSAVKFRGKWRPWGNRGFVLIWNIALCAYFVQDFLSAEHIVLHPKQTLLFLPVTLLQLTITSHATMTNEHESHSYP